VRYEDDPPPARLHLCDLPLPAQIRHQRLCVPVEAHVAMHACIVAPAVYARVRQVVWEEIAQPVDAVACRLRHFAVSVQAMDRHNARAGLAVDRTIGQNGHILLRCMQ
jgi:hypothetical protein